MQQLILGGVRSGKSRHAQQLAQESDKPVTLIATATAGDEEMLERIRRHQQERPAHWQVIEEPLALSAALQQSDDPGAIVLVDCLTLWLTNLLLEEDSHRLEQEQDNLLACLPLLQADLLLVSNEVGQGIIPADPLSRRFADETGRLHQRLARACDRVTMITAGLPQTLKG
ncbi:bifunctional adenosylcobinamide kinase/adenosylcobinamide-phosphate guanylyltransferase [Thiohalophilus thiocyanatoxydans]|uniref:Bifunctional adenosylcobalamin biosynthesis protein n=1 Tax=Thiohalophilus thiocyanatoxydans TaxID=381308 RepID=A0A4R8IFG5_9GAMM|nr:bifunctional adenosylcobinamide kinase/adenosylcobinamide-phosphate guanylyltransferase [Thiohalophilus thiocyanatoxydans]TDX97902.1 adenosylcobinamide kinase /adenosylcobinamide-phosphate guanylyltransferase [Thiohalophilus thiocyanatoxydans]